MSVIDECLEGNIIYSIFEWWANSEYFDENRKVTITERKIEVGEELFFIDAYLDKRNLQKSYAWQVVFRCKDGYTGHAAHFNFVTIEDWNSLKKHFKEIL